jgi:ABC-2 type transport system ATP-binding protein
MTVMATGSATDPIITVQNLVKTYAARGRGADEVKAVQDLSFAVKAGEFFGFLGPNGSGKSTTIKVITTLLRKTSGTVRVAGYDVDREPDAVRRVIGYTGQAVGVDGQLTARENLMLIGRYYHLHGPALRRQVDELLTILQLNEAADRRADTFSGGMRRRLDLGAGLVHRPRVLFLDEPTTGLDPQTRNGVWEHLRRLHRSEGMTVFLTTQYMEEADQLCERLAIIDRGKIVAEGTPDALKAEIGSDVVSVRLPRSEDFDAVRGQALSVIQKVPGVNEVKAFDGGVTVYAANAGATLLEILRVLETERLAVQEVAISRPTLDEVFLKYTGRAMKIEEVKPMSRMPFGGRRRMN